MRLTNFQLAVVAILSAAATGLVIAGAHGRSAAQIAALEDLHHRRVIDEAAAVQTPAAQPVSSGAAPAATPAPVGPASGSGASGGPGSGAAGASAGGATSTTATSAAKPTPTPLPKVKHVFVIALTTTSFKAAFGPHSIARYLNHTLKPKGTLLSGYRALGTSELPDYLAMISGQSPNPDTRGNCPSYAEFPANAKPAADGVVHDRGCVYPNTVITIGDQVTGTGHVWKAFIQNMGTSTCVHPNSDAADNGPIPGAGPQYTTRHNPFIYFHSLLDLGGCASDDVALTQLPAALRAASRTPRYSFIAPRACLDPAASRCPGGGAGGLAGEDAFLKRWVPRILASPAYRADGVLIIAFAHSAGHGRGGPAPPITTGALVLSRYATAGKTITTAYNAYSLLRSSEDLLGYQPLAKAKSAASFAASALTASG